MLIDKFLPVYDVAKKHDIIINSSASTVYWAVCNADLKESPLIRFLFALRGLPSSALTLRGFENIRFAKLGVVQDQEYVLGLVGKFWTPTGDLQIVDADSFPSFSKPGYARAVWDFRLSSQDDGSTLLTTETRVQCTDRWSSAFFRLYWFFIGPFSGLIRKEMLRIVKRNAESQSPSGS